VKPGLKKTVNGDMKLRMDILNKDKTWKHLGLSVLHVNSTLSRLHLLGLQDA